MNYIHPGLARARQANLIGAVDEHRIVDELTRIRPATLRERAGWTLVGLGLQLMGRPLPEIVDSRQAA